MEQKEIQEKLLKYQILKNKIEALERRRELLITRILEVENTISTLDEIKVMKEKDIILPLGSGIYISGSLKDIKSMVVMISRDVAIDMNSDEAKESLEKNRNILENGLKAIENEMIKLSDELIKLEPEIRNLTQKISG